MTSLIAASLDKDKEIRTLVQTFQDNFEQYHQYSYKEAQVRKEFIDKLFVLLGWDVNNRQGIAEQYKEVINEDAIRIGGKVKAPDYAFRIGGTRIFFVEAKKPSVNIKEDPEPSFQLRRYAWNSKIPLSVLTNFESLAIYDCRFKPNQNDSPSVGRLLLMSYTDLIDRFQEIESILSKESVLKGSFDRYVNASKGKRGTSEVDDEFLKEIDEYREILAKNIVLRNPTLSIAEVNYAVQQTLNRILFLRICEDRGIESYEGLKEISDKKDIYDRLLSIFENADQKYNSGIFDFNSDRITKSLRIDDRVLHEIIVGLYYPISPYDFSILRVEVLGSVYERFLGKRIELRGSHQIKVEEKPEVRKAGGVYYTPEYVVSHMVKNTLGAKIEGKSPKEIEKIRILDPACGSGTFLVSAYSYLLDYHLAYYLKNPTKYKKEIYQVKENRWFLSTEIRKKILLNNIFGVDIDPLAVEITKLSLLLKVLENETKESVNQQLKLFRERALPNIDNNVRCGNSLVDSSYFKHTLTALASSEDVTKIRPFDWDDAENGFGKVIKEGGFDIIIGNPPYVKEYTNKEIFEPIKKTSLAKYYQGKMDYWYFFTCKSIDLLKEDGLLSFIAQNNWITSSGASIMRNKVLTDTTIISFFDFNDFKVFKDAGIQTMVFVAQKKAPSNVYEVDYSKVIDKEIAEEEVGSCLLNQSESEKITHYKAKLSPDELIDKTIDFASAAYSAILNKIRLKANFQLTDKEVANGIHHHHDRVDKARKEILGDHFAVGDGIFIISNAERDRIHFTEKELELIKPSYTAKEFSRYYGNPKNQEWVIYTDSRFKDKKLIEKYPNIKRHLDQFTKVITSDNRPYGLHRAREERLFQGEKIIALRKCAIPTFTYVDFDSYVPAMFYVIKTERINQKYLTGLLNSKLIAFWLKHKGKMQGTNYQLDKEPLLAIPILKPSDSKQTSYQTEIIGNVDMIIAALRKLENTKLAGERLLVEKQVLALQKRIDENVYSLYELSDEEVKAVESNFA